MKKLIVLCKQDIKSTLIAATQFVDNDIINICYIENGSNRLAEYLLTRDKDSRVLVLTRTNRKLREMVSGKSYQTFDLDALIAHILKDKEGAKFSKVIDFILKNSIAIEKIYVRKSYQTQAKFKRLISKLKDIVYNNAPLDSLMDKEPINLDMHVLFSQLVLIPTDTDTLDIIENYPDKKSGLYFLKKYNEYSDVKKRAVKFITSKGNKIYEL